jgi:hypothetical protein
LRPGTVVGLAPLAPVAHQAGPLQNAQVLGDRRLRDSGPLGERPHGLFAVVTQALEDRPAGRIAQGLEEGVLCDVHAKPITH